MSFSAQTMKFPFNISFAYLNNFFVKIRRIRHSKFVAFLIKLIFDKISFIFIYYYIKY